MNTIVLIKKGSHDVFDNTDNVKIIVTNNTLESFKQSFEEKLHSFVENLQRLLKPMNEAVKKLTDEDYGDKETENMRVFSKLHAQVEEFKKQNFIFEFENQYLNLKDYFWNDEYFYECDIVYLEDWIKQKQQEVVNPPDYSY